MAEIYSSTGDFHKVEKKLKAISAMTVDTFLGLYEKYFVGNGKKKISSQVKYRDTYMLIKAWEHLNW